MVWFRNCPACSARLATVRHNGVEVDRCGACGGIWLDAGEFRSLLNARKDLLDFLPPHVRSGLAATGRPCPACRGAMAPVPPTALLPAAAEVCLHDGGCWIDGAERERMEAAVARRTLRLNAPDAAVEQARADVVQAQRVGIEARLERARRLRVEQERQAEDAGEDVEHIDDLDLARSVGSFLGLPVESGAIFRMSAVVTMLLIVVNLAVFAIGLFQPGSGWMTALGGLPAGWGEGYGFVPVQFERNPQLHAWRLLTSMFLHAGVLHLAGNLYFLFTTGDDVESRMGPVLFLLFYLAGGIVADLASLWHGHGAGIPHVGASGAIAAVMGAYVVLFPRKRLFIRLRYSMRLFGVSAWMYLGFWAVVQTIGLRAADSRVDYAAHLGGLAFGALAGLVLRLLQRYDASTGGWNWIFKRSAADGAGSGG